MLGSNTDTHSQSGGSSVRRQQASTLDQVLRLCTPSRPGHWCLRLTAEQTWRRSHPDEDPALKGLPTATDGYLHPVLELNGVLENKDSFRDVAQIHTAHHHLVVGQVEATADVLEILLSEHSAEREDVTGVLAIAQDDRRARTRCSVAVQVLRAVCHPGWH